MNENDDFDMKELRTMQLQAIRYCFRQDLLTAKVIYQDRLRRFDYANITYVTRKEQPIAEAFLGIQPILFMRN